MLTGLVSGVVSGLVFGAICIWTRRKYQANADVLDALEALCGVAEKEYRSGALLLDRKAFSRALVNAREVLGKCPLGK